MRDRMERLVLLPFAVGCMSESSVGIASQQQQHPRRSKTFHSPTIIRNEETERDESEDDALSDDASKGSTALPKPNLSIGIHRLFKGFKNISHMFVYKEETEEEEEIEIEIGLPTDVKHVTHIGWDGYAAATNYPIKGGCNNWDSIFLNDHSKLQLLSKSNDVRDQIPPSAASDHEITRSETPKLPADSQATQVQTADLTIPDRSSYRSSL